MPELPEVETVKNGLVELFDWPIDIESVHRSKFKLRFPMPRGLVKNLSGRKVRGIQRRAKYLLFDLGDKILLNHLGMTGSWRKQTDFKLKKHDHFSMKVSDNQYLVYNDPRRFGYFDLIDKTNWSSSNWFKHLGPEPLSESFNVDYLKLQIKSRKAPIKNVIMDQKVVVGVGNIYASEALYLAGIRPSKKAHRVPVNKLPELVQSIKQVLAQAIEAGGTTLRDFRQAGGSEGYFQTKLLVYGREGELCSRCQGPIYQVRLGGRSSYFCKNCQQ